MFFDEFIKQYNEIFKAYNAEYHKFAVCYGISDSALMILYEMRACGKMLSQKDLGYALSLSKQTVNSAVKSLEKTGLVISEEIEDDRRGRYVKFTAEGLKFAEEKIDRILQAERKAFDGLTTLEAADLIKLEKKYFLKFKEAAAKGLNGG